MDGPTNGTTTSRLIPRPVVEPILDPAQLLDPVRGQVAALGKVLAQQPVGILVRAAQPGAGRIGENTPSCRCAPMCSWWASSLPWSQVRVCRAAAGS
jgi:hypothetical protein